MFKLNLLEYKSAKGVYFLLFSLNPQVEKTSLAHTFFRCKKQFHDMKIVKIDSFRVFFIF